MSDNYDSFLKELDKELEEENNISKVHYAKISYKKECKKRQKRLTVGIILAAFFEFVVLAGAGFFAYQNNFYLRTLYEFENVFLGKITRDSGIYVGSTDFGYFDGEGTFQFFTGTIYDGEWDDNTISGKGSLKIPDYGEYVGDFSNNSKEGFGTFTWSDGSFYKGEWKQDELNGEGEYCADNGTIYSGTFKDNKLYNGNCQFHNDTGNYKLEYIEGEAKKAQISFSDGSYYEGDFEGNTISGKGKITYACGDSYEGDFKDGKKSGKGKYSWTNGAFYDGEWTEDLGNGNGTYILGEGITRSGKFENNLLIEGTIIINNEYGEYFAEVSDGVANKITISLLDGTIADCEADESGYIARATISYPNGDKYDGEIENGMKNGKGKYSWKKGASYNGSWENDVMSGKGTYKYSSEEYPNLVVSFKKGKPEGEGTYTDKKQMSYKTTWKDGKCVKVTE